jgi:molybdenum cofactor cytidylyltransferase
MTPAMQNTVAAIILAAGTSSRMSTDRYKLLLPLGKRPVLLHVVEAALASQARPVIIVTGHQASQVRAILTRYMTSPDLQVVENADYQQGMSTSLRAGVRTLLSYNTDNNVPYANTFFTIPTAALVMLGDQPLVSTRLLDQLITIYMAGGKKIVAPAYQGKRGNPVLFDASLFPELMQVGGDEGGRGVIQQHMQDMTTIEVDDMKASYDVDTWEAYQQVVREWEQAQRGRSS